FVGLFELVYPYVEQVNRMNLGGPVTQFEIIAAMGFVMAREMGLEAMVLEAGMGGRWDATNVASSEVVGLTGVSLEHTHILGKTIGEIAAEKAEVIKRGAKAATLSGDSRVLDILEDKVLKEEGKLYRYGRDFKVLRSIQKKLKGWKLDIEAIYGSYKGIGLPLMGRYQPRNLALAVALSELYAGGRIDEVLLGKSAGSIKVAGRFEVISEKPAIIADASHNPESIEWFLKNLEDYFPNSKKIIIFAVLRDKDYRQMIARVMEAADTLIITSSGTERSLDIDALEAEVLAAGNSKAGPEAVYKIDSIQNSLKYALKISGSNDIICITGSITNLQGVV
ncbi:MAG: bifunctional folylpolyglutamate synthase/dihydrofolate synthase, partial [Actinomycetota bacterium]